MELNAYQEKALGTAEYPNIGNNLVYPALGIAGESGELVDKVKKLWRNEGKTSGKAITDAQRNELVKEMGDVLWYLAALASEVGVKLGAVAVVNILKLEDRKARGVIKSQGDNR